MARECRGDSADVDIILLTSGVLGRLGLNWRPGGFSYQARQLRLVCDFLEETCSGRTVELGETVVILTLLTLLF